MNMVGSERSKVSHSVVCISRVLPPFQWSTGVCMVLAYKFGLIEPI